MLKLGFGLALGGLVLVTALRNTLIGQVTDTARVRAATIVELLDGAMHTTFYAVPALLARALAGCSHQAPAVDRPASLPTGNHPVALDPADFTADITHPREDGAILEDTVGSVRG